MLGMDPLIIAAALVDLAIGVETALAGAHGQRGSELAAGGGLAIAADRGLHLADRMAQRLGARRLGDEVQEAADLARPVDGRGRAAHHVDLRGVADRGGIGAPVLDQLEALEVVLRQGAADVELARHAIEAGRIAGGRYGHEVVDGLDAIALDGHVADQARRARRLDQRLLQAEDGGVGLALQKPRPVRGDDDLGRRRRGRAGFGGDGAGKADQGAAGASRQQPTAKRLRHSRPLGLAPHRLGSRSFLKLNSGVVS